MGDLEEMSSWGGFPCDQYYLRTQPYIVGCKNVSLRLFPILLHSLDTFYADSRYPWALNRKLEICVFRSFRLLSQSQMPSVSRLQNNDVRTWSSTTKRKTNIQSKVRFIRSIHCSFITDSCGFWFHPQRTPPFALAPQLVMASRRSSSRISHTPTPAPPFAIGSVASVKSVSRSSPASTASKRNAVAQRKASTPPNIR